jgi:hypothetical protein
MTRDVINLDKPRKLLYDLNAMQAYEKITGKSAFDPIEKVDATVLGAMLWACLIHEDDAITLKDVGKLVTIKNLNYVASKLNKVIEESIQTDSEESGDSSKN